MGRVCGLTFRIGIAISAIEISDGIGDFKAHACSVSEYSVSIDEGILVGISLNLSSIYILDICSSTHEASDMSRNIIKDILDAGFEI